ncbi:MAG: tetratricopeptide repeat protein [Pseudomonadota bacterium]
MATADSHRETARHQYLVGEFDAAIEAQRAAIAIQAKEIGEVLLSDYRQLALFLIAAQRSTEALEVLLPVVKAKPDHAEMSAILGLVFTNLRRHDEALPHLKRALEIDDRNYMAADQLTRCYLGKRDIKQTKKYGELSLTIKDTIYRQEDVARSMPPLPAFDRAKKQGNVIAFSLWGSNERYLWGALRNCELAAELYPLWQCRYYIDGSVPEQFVKKLDARGADIRRMPTSTSLYDGLFWRFHVASDEKISRFLIRDCDAVINVKECVAVEEWLRSDKHFHIMRDYYSHTDLIMAGMWGGVSGAIENIEELIEEFKRTHIRSRIMDQVFLNEAIWPLIREHCLVHDSCFSSEKSVTFPPYCDLPPGRHIGQDEYTVLRANS